MFLIVGFAVVCIAPVLVLLFKALREEKEGRAEVVLSGAVSRMRYVMGFIVLAVLASLLMPFVITVGLWFVSSLMMEVPLVFGSLLRSMMVYVPALWVMLGLGVFVVGVYPKAAALCWAYFTYIFIVGFFGDLLNMPRWAMRLSPFYHVPQLPLEDMHMLPLLVLTGLALVLTVCGLVAYRRRDVV